MSGPPTLLERARGGEVRALGRVISQVENAGPAGAAILAQIYPLTGKARLVGLTGPPGVGKSTLVDRLTRHARGLGLRVAIVAVDPTSPFSGGAILGDRIRMERHFLDPGVYIRSMATRGHLGGIAAATADVVDVLDAVGYDVVLVETIGVGQDAVEIAKLVGCCLLVLTPGLGDDIQAMKGGMMEIGDIYVVNKADLGGADRVEAVLSSHLAIQGLEEERPIVRTTASQEQGIVELYAAIVGTEARLGAERIAVRGRARARQRIEAIIADRLQWLVRRDVAGSEAWQRQSERVARRELDPYAAADELLASAGLAAGIGGAR